MADFNKILTPGDYENGIINVVVEIPTGSTHKIEWNRDLAVMQLDRVEPKAFAKPTNYGFIPQTLDEDGDELDVLLITNDPHTGNAYKTLADLPEQLIKQIEFHFNHYKDLKKAGTTKVEKFGDIEEAKEVIAESIARWNEK